MIIYFKIYNHILRKDPKNNRFCSYINGLFYISHKKRASIDALFKILINGIINSHLLPLRRQFGRALGGLEGFGLGG